ncbi:unnamed protein product [Bursaphelenchus okinawaensis]|uniref:DNA mismatch repair proteins mutS family domain-containing protein n=1 Tax=Bursaphelenchus okinawaensis TaxID=465554 RepID=A0A811LL90_9BILA|nr:unnamed protein product [Bursaphelenchus okinawaensis]CAG9126142.1 unnamed protein product [Bursaphelenchus okinawaensis]
MERGKQKYNIANGGAKRANITTSTSVSFNIVALLEGRGSDRGTVGMAAIDLRSMEVSLFQFVDTSAYSLLKVTLGLLDPLEVILQDYTHDKFGVARVLYDVVTDLFPEAEIQLVSRRYYDEEKGIELVKRYIVEEASNLDNKVYKKSLAMACVFSLLRYVEMIQKVSFLTKSLKFRYETVEDSCLIDVCSWDNLDLFHRRKSNPKKGEVRCLFDRVNCCVTNGGARTLSSFLLQPSVDVMEISERLDVVEELILEPTVLERCRRLLRTVQDLQQIITLCVHADKSTSGENDNKRLMRQKIIQILSLRNLLDTLKPMQSIVQNMRSGLILKNAFKIMDPRLKEILQLIDEKIDNEVLSNNVKGSLGAKDAVLYAVRDDQHVQLALARKVYNELLVHVNELVSQEGFQGIGASLSYTYGKGYHYNIKKKIVNTLPPECLQVVSNRQNVTFTTHNMIKYNDRLVQLESEILQKSEMVVNQCLAGVKDLLPALYSCVEFLSLLDCLCSFATYSSSISVACRPRFGTQMAVKDGRYAILDNDKTDFIPNDTFVSTDTRFVLITGPNMTGKSTYLKQICLLQILAQAGCFVPARAALFMVRKSIYCRIGHNDDLSDNLSSFGVEMSEMSSILNHADENSLVVVDELARSTAVEEGISICFAIGEELIKKKSVVLFATHYLDLCLLETKFTCLRNFHFSSETGTDEDGKEFLKPSHVLHVGPYKGPLYGLELAEISSLPSEIIANARGIAEKIRSTVESKRAASNVDIGMERKRQFCILAHRILHLIDRHNFTADEKSVAYLLQLQEKFKDLKADS